MWNFNYSILKLRTVCKICQQGCLCYYRHGQELLNLFLSLQKGPEVHLLLSYSLSTSYTLLLSIMPSHANNIIDLPPIHITSSLYNIQPSHLNSPGSFSRRAGSIFNPSDMARWWKMIWWMRAEGPVRFRGRQEAGAACWCGQGRLSQYAAHVSSWVEIFMMQAHVFQSTGTFSLISTVALRAKAALAKAETPRLDWHFTLADIVIRAARGWQGKKDWKKESAKEEHQLQGRRYKENVQWRIRENWWIKEWGTERVTAEE